MQTTDVDLTLIFLGHRETIIDRTLIGCLTPNLFISDLLKTRIQIMAHSENTN